MKNPYVEPLTSIAIMVSTPFIILIVGALAVVFSSSYDRVCTADDNCTTTLKFGGWGAVPLQGIAGAVGTGFSVYLAVKNRKLPESKESGNDLPS